MTVEFSLILMLLLCVGILTALLYKRIKSEKNRAAFIRKLSMHELTDFMRKNSLDGSISAVARQFSDILKSTFEIEYIIFLRKKRGMLELNYYHGIKSFNRIDFKIDYSMELMNVLKQDFFPRDISLIKKFLTNTFIRKVENFQMDKFFPLFWRDNLYGFYIIKSNKATNTDSFNLVIAQLAQSLAAAYHIKWHESKLEQLYQRIHDTKISTHVIEGDRQVERVLNLIKHKKTDAIIPQIINSLLETSQVENLIFIYDTKDLSSTELLYAGTQPTNLPNPNCSELHTLTDMIDVKAILSIEELSDKTSDKLLWMENLKNNNINFVTSFPLSSKRKGLLAWKQNGESAEINQRIDMYKRYLIDIFENVEELESLEELSYTDNLTTLANRRYFYKRMYEELNRAERYNRKLALIIFDIDELKKINDTYGHQAGDVIIRQIGKILKTSIRTIDVVARYGGDEFCIIMPEADKDTCMKFVKRLQEKIVTATFGLEQAKKSISCTISMGVSIYPDHAENCKKLLYAADMALLKAKESGRNRALLASSSVQTE